MTIPAPTSIGKQLGETLGGAKLLVNLVNHTIEEIKSKAKRDGRSVEIELLVMIDGFVFSKASLSRPMQDENSLFLYISGLNENREDVFILTHSSKISVKFETTYSESENSDAQI